MEIKKGEYVRTCFGEIGECIDKTSECCVIKYNKIETELIFKENIKEVVKHSFNIIDLIEIKDIVEIQNVSDKLCFKVEIFDEKTLMDLKLGLEDNEIKLLSIVTKEQMKSVEYKIKEW